METSTIAICPRVMLSQAYLLEGMQVPEEPTVTVHMVIALLTDLEWVVDERQHLAWLALWEWMRL